jgi:hypothetical protein
MSEQVATALSRLEQRADKRLGDADAPLLVSVRSGARESMPGMLDTVLNLGLNDASVLGLARSADNARFAWDSYRRFVQMFANVRARDRHTAGVAWEIAVGRGHRPRPERRRRYRGVVLPLGFRFDADAVLVGGVAHRTDCERVPLTPREDVVSVPAACVYRAECCPRECHDCRPPFETMLSYQLE